MKLLKIFQLFTLIAAFMMAGSAIASIDTACGTTTWKLTAGQTIDVGTVAVSNDQTNLYVTYAITRPGTTFGTLHLWVGNDLANVPETKNGSNAGIPIPGQFPYQTDATGKPSYTFAIPFSDLKIQDVAKACPLALYVVAHAEVIVDGQKETAFGGDIAGVGSRWWFYGKYNVCCDVPPPPVISQCQTAFAKGNYVFTTDTKSNPEKLPSLKLTKNRWGWAINQTSQGTTAYSIYAGAGLNNIANGTKVGALTVNWNGSTATVTYKLDDPAVMKELHVYAGDTQPTTVAPGQYGYTQYFDPATNTHTATFNVTDTNSDGIWVIGHAVTCK